MKCWADWEPPPPFPWWAVVGGFAAGVGVCALALVLAVAKGWLCIP